MTKKSKGSKTTDQTYTLLIGDILFIYYRQNKLPSTDPLSKLMVIFPAWYHSHGVPLSILYLPLKTGLSTAEQIAFAYKLRWNIEIFFGWWKRHLKVYHLISRSQYGLMVQIMAGLITYILLAIYCHDQHQEKVSVKRLREISINIRSEMSIEDIMTETGVWIYCPPNQDQSHANP